jgi:predicted unusual protein kinase regulating ubiquinone biosynthesis (AarF/ABC1/UbiB family)
MACMMLSHAMNIAQDTMVSSIIHLANKDYPSLVDDFIDLGILPKDSNRAKVRGTDENGTEMLRGVNGKLHRG